MIRGRTQPPDATHGHTILCWRAQSTAGAKGVGVAARAGAERRETEASAVASKAYRNSVSRTSCEGQAVLLRQAGSPSERGQGLTGVGRYIWWVTSSQQNCGNDQR
jgi:hypothetical protein